MDKPTSHLNTQANWRDVVLDKEALEAAKATFEQSIIIDFHVIIENAIRTYKAAELASAPGDEINIVYALLEKMLSAADTREAKALAGDPYKEPNYTQELTQAFASWHILNQFKIRLKKAIKNHRQHTKPNPPEIPDSWVADIRGVKKKLELIQEHSLVDTRKPIPPSLAVDLVSIEIYAEKALATIDRLLEGK